MAVDDEPVRVQNKTMTQIMQAVKDAPAPSGSHASRIRRKTTQVTIYDVVGPSLCVLKKGGELAWRKIRHPARPAFLWASAIFPGASWSNDRSLVRVAP